MSSNQLTSLLDSFGSLTVGGDLNLDIIHLTSPPEEFGSLTVGGNMHLGMNLIAAEFEDEDDNEYY